MPPKQVRRILGTQVVRFQEVGQTFNGVLKSRETRAGTTHEYGVYHFTSDGNRYMVNGTDQLDDALSEAKIGDTIEIKFLGKGRSLSGYEYHQFQVECVYRPEVDEGDQHE